MRANQSDLLDDVRPRPMSRRRFFRAAAAGWVAGLGALSYARFVEPHWVHVERRAMPIANLPDALLGRRLVHITDLHVGHIVDDDYLKAMLRWVNGLRPDVLAITGDFMTCRAGEQVDHAARVLSVLTPAAFGTFAVLGNHDYGRTFQRDDVADALVRRLDGVGIRTLRNDIANVRGLQIAGLDEYWSPNFGPERVLPRLDPRRAALVLCHNPDAADEPGWGDYRGHILCGHTHGGQCAAPLFGPPFMPVRNKRYTSGEIDLGDGRVVYINPGLGYTRRVRFNVRPEITVFKLTRA